MNKINNESPESMKKKPSKEADLMPACLSPRIGVIHDPEKVAAVAGIISHLGNMKKKQSRAKKVE